MSTYLNPGTRRDQLDKDKILGRYQRSIENPPHFIINFEKNIPRTEVQTDQVTEFDWRLETRQVPDN